MFYLVKRATAYQLRPRQDRKIQPLQESPTQIRAELPMLVVEVHGIMKAATKKHTRNGRSNGNEWLYRLLADIHQEVASQPTPQAVARIRRRLLTEIRPPARAAA